MNDPRQVRPAEQAVRTFPEDTTTDIARLMSEPPLSASERRAFLRRVSEGCD